MFLPRFICHAAFGLFPGVTFGVRVHGRKAHETFSNLLLPSGEFELGSVVPGQEIVRVCNSPVGANAEEYEIYWKLQNLHTSFYLCMNISFSGRYNEQRGKCQKHAYRKEKEMHWMLRTCRQTKSCF